MEELVAQQDQNLLPELHNNFLPPEISIHHSYLLFRNRIGLLVRDHNQLEFVEEQWGQRKDVHQAFRVQQEHPIWKDNFSTEIQEWLHHLQTL